MPRKKIVCPNGIEFGSKADMARHYGIDKDLYYSRVNERGWSMAEALEIVARRESIKTADGKEFDSITKFAKYYGIGASTCIRKLRDGCAPDEVIDQARKKVVVCPNGKEFQSMKDMLDHYGVTKYIYKKRIKNGWSMAKALGIEGKHLDSERKPHESISMIAYKNGVKYSKLLQNAANGSDIDKVIKDNQGECKYVKTVFGVDAKDIARAHGIKKVRMADLTYDFIYNRVMWENPEFKGLTEDGMAVIRSSDGFKLIEFKKYIEKLNSKIQKEEVYRYTCPNGNKFRTQLQMAEYYGVKLEAYKSRLARGYSEKAALGIEVEFKGVVCPKGKIFKSKSEMREHYGIDRNQYYSRLKKGWSMAEVLGIEKREDDTEYVICPMGNKFKSKAEMTRHYGINYLTFKYRINNGWTTEEALEIVGKQEGVTCPKGKKFKTTKSMCDHYGIRPETYRRRIKLGWPIEEALEIVEKDGIKKSITCPKGIEFPSIADMVKHYEVSYAKYNRRIKSGWSVEEALGLREREKTVVCPNGNRFRSVNEMANYYGIRHGVYSKRIKRGLSVEEALEIKTVKCPNGNTFKTLREMSKHYGVSYASFNSRRANGWSIAEALGLEGRGIGADERHAKVLSRREKNKYLIQMCKDKGVSYRKVKYRIDKGSSVEEAIAYYTTNARLVICPNGIEFKSNLDMCKFYGIKSSVYYERLKYGRTKAEALRIEEEKNADYVVDGKKYSRIVDIAFDYGIPYKELRDRIKRGENVNDALRIAKAKYSNGLFGVSIESILEAHGVTYKRANRVTVNHVIDKVLCTKKEFNGLTDDGMVVLKSKNGLKLVEFKSYIDNMSASM